MRRRPFLLALAALPLAPPLLAQHAGVAKRIGILLPVLESDAEMQGNLAAFSSALERLGWKDGANLRIDYRWAGGAERSRLVVLAKELVAQRPDAILTRTTAAAVALAQATKAVPIVFVSVTDPVGDGLVQSLARPGGNATGFTNFEPSHIGKWLELLKQLDPRVTRVAIVSSPKHAPRGGLFFQAALDKAAASMGLKAVAVNIENAADLDSRRNGTGCPPSTRMRSRRARAASCPTARIPTAFTARPPRMSIASSAARGRPISPCRRPHVSAGAEPQGRQDDRPDHPERAAGACRRGDRMTTRRALLLASAGALALPALGQQAKVWHIGILATGPWPGPLDKDRSYGAFIGAMRDLGYVAGKNVRYDARFAEGKLERLPGLVAELIAARVDVMVVANTPAARAAKEATRTIPVVMIEAGDPVGTGLVASLARPGGNLTGMSNLSVDLSPKRVEILKAAVPSLGSVAALFNPRNPTFPMHAKGLREATEKAGVRLVLLEVRNAGEIEAAFRSAREQRADAVLVHHDTLFSQERSRVMKFAEDARLVCMFGASDYADAGGLLSYGTSAIDNYRGVAVFVDKILKGARPADLPVELPRRIELVVNMKAAKRAQLQLPQALLLRADRVIE